MAVTDELNIVISADTGRASQNISSTADELNKLGETAKNTDGDMSALVKAISESAASMVSVSQNIAASAAGISGFHNGFDALSGTLQDISTKFDTLNVSIQNTSFGDAASRVAELSAASEASAQALNGISAAADDFGSHMGTLSDATKGSADGMSDLKSELSAALSSVRNFSGNMGEAGQEALEASKKIKELSEQVNKIPKGNNVTDLTKSFRTLKGIVATLGIGSFIKQSNDAYNVQMQNELKLTAYMKHRMNATDDEIRSIKELASEQQKIGVIGDEIQLAGAQQLTTYARQSSTLKTLIPAMNNLIAQNAGYEASVGDATSAADMLGRALTGQYTSLKRMRVTFTEAQEQVLKYGTEEQKAIVLADAINSKVGNMNQLLASTPTGQLKQLQNNFGGLQKQLGATFQPLISAVIPLARGFLEMLAPPIMNVSRGAVVLGSALAQLDSPAVRAIALTAAGIAVVNKLRMALGGTTAILLVAGVLLSGFIGSMQEEQESIGDIVNNAFNGAQDAIGGAEGAMSDFNEEVTDTQKAVNRLAGFDTLTKLSGGSTGSLLAGLINDGDLDKIFETTSAVGDLNDAFASIETPSIDVNLDKAWDAIQSFGSDFWKVLFGTDEEQYTALNNLTNKIENVFGPEFTDFWKGVGSSIYNVINGDESEVYKGWYDLNNRVSALLGDFFEKEISPRYQKLGQSLYYLADGIEKIKNEDPVGASKSFVLASLKGVQTSPVFNQEQKEAFERASSYFETGDYTNANIAYNNATDDIKKSLQLFDELPDKIADELQLDMEGNFTWLGDMKKGWDEFWKGVGSGIFNAQYEGYVNMYTNTSVEKNDSQTSRYDVPLRPTGIPSDVPVNVIVNNYLDGEEISAATETRINDSNVISNGIYS